MKTVHMKTVGKLIFLALVLLIADVIIGYTLEVSHSVLQKGANSYYLEMGIFRMLSVTLGFYILVAGWVYLAAVAIYHFYYTFDSFRDYFLYLIIAFFAFYLSVNYSLVGVSKYLLGYFAVMFLIYYVILRGEYFKSKSIKKASAFFLIFLLFFYFYWRMEELESWILLKHIIAYIPLAWIGQKIYSSLFDQVIHV